MRSLEEAVAEAARIGIGGHVRPDGDCVGSCLGVYNYIRSRFPDRDAAVFLEPIPEVFTFLKHADAIRQADDDAGQPPDLFIALDCGDVRRLGKAGKLFLAAKRTVCIDHHISNEAFADDNYVFPNASSTCELICDLIPDGQMNRDIAECLYTGIVHDTGVFQYSSTSAKTMQTAGRLMDYGIDYPRIIEYTYYEKTFVQNRIMGVALLNARRLDEDRVVASVITRKDMEEQGALPVDTDGIVNQLRITKGADIALFLYENADGSYKVSTRTSSDINLAEIAVEYGGGGHEKAAGFTACGDPWEIVEEITGKVRARRK